MDVVVGAQVPQFICETFYEDGKVRLKPIKGQCVPETFRISSSRAYRESFSVGSHFICRDGYFMLKGREETVYIKASDVITYKTVRITNLKLN